MWDDVNKMHLLTYLIYIIHNWISNVKLRLENYWTMRYNRRLSSDSTILIIFKKNYRLPHKMNRKYF